MAKVSIIFLIAAFNANAVGLYDRQTGKYLGELSANQYDENSVSNPYGKDYYL